MIKLNDDSTITKIILETGQRPLDSKYPKGSLLHCRWTAETVVAVSKHQLDSASCSPVCNESHNCTKSIVNFNWNSHVHSIYCDSTSCPTFSFHKHFDPNVHTKKTIKVSNDSITFTAKEPFALKVGLQFKFKALEKCLLSMAEGERARFIVLPPHTLDYSQLAVVLEREAGHIGASCCSGANPLAAIFSKDAVPKQKMDLFRKTPAHLRPFLFAENAHSIMLEISLEKILLPEQVTKEIWEMTADEKLDLASRYKAQAAELLTAKNDYAGALLLLDKSLHYINGLLATGYCSDTEKLQLEFDTLVVSIRLNLALAQLKCRQFAAAAENMSWLISRSMFGEQNSFAYKIFFRRALARLELGRDLHGAESDFENSLRYLALHPTKSKDKQLKHEIVTSKQNLSKKLQVILEKEARLYKKVFTGIFS